MIVQLRNIEKSFGHKELFKDLNLEIKKNDKLAIVGPNGVGKTTLFNILRDEEPYDAGQMFWKRNIRKGFLEQIHVSQEDLRLDDYFSSAYHDLIQMEQDMKELEETMKHDHSDKILKSYDSLQEEFLRRGGYTIQSELMTLLTKFGFNEHDLKKNIKEFSGGQVTRLAFVRLLLQKPDVLFLDEPTNHLDIETIEWLESYLMSYDGTVVLISHDRLFLDRICSSIVDIDDYQAYRYEGNYTSFVKLKEQDIQRKEKQYIQQQKEIVRLETLIDKFRAKSSKAAFAKSKQKYLDRMDRVERHVDKNYEFKAQFKSRLRGGGDVLITDSLEVGYDKPLFSIDLDLKHGRRYAVLGDNGTGKSTLLKTVAGRLEPLSGEMMLGHQIELGYFDQQLLDFSDKETVLEEVWDDFPELDHTEVRQALAQFLFKADDVFKAVSVLSGGERVRLSLVKLMLKQANFLVLDEPTNHLDIYGKEALEKSLNNYDGSMLFVSHDRYFIEKVATDILLIKDGKIYHSEKEISQVLQDEADQVNEEKVERKLEYKDFKRLQTRQRNLELELEDLHKDLDVHREFRFDPDYYHDYEKMAELNDVIDAIHNDIKKREIEWEEVSLQLEDK
ncbi:ABC-F family ATP-binding cassette domain-containing protein [Erysipelothrix urinaevulpis]|uniref:ABC-F family ATP-binding cassette domain-containing protein n=1 Tax=Erysipelothrix urinaevulpis TaxID=2683717 RepID=UPI00135CB96E|nr:ABC-F family ATP-binding cassette domain-containing protein [Erysipelothrix urinaevulpis]